MVSRKMMTNLEIYNKANNLLTTFEDIEHISLPVKVHFYFQKNMNTLIAMARELEERRMEILKSHNIIDRKEEVEPELMEKVNKDINDLFSLEQEVKFYTFSIDWLEGIELNAKQVQAFSFMIDDEEE